MLESLGHYEQCARIRLDQGLLWEAAESYLAAKMPKEARECLKQFMLRSAPLGTDYSSESGAERKAHIKKALTTMKQISEREQTADLVIQAYRYAIDPTQPRAALAKAAATPGSCLESERLLILDILLQKDVTVMQLDADKRAAYLDAVKR